MFKLFKNKKSSPCSIEYIVVGLGNPDRKYERTRHNAGFIALDTIAQECCCEIKKLKFKSLCGETSIKGHRILLMKPQTYMNNSGQAVTEAMSFYKIPPERTIIIFDDISLDIGKMRIRKKGSDGGQKGMKSIIYLSGSDTFPRIKLGIGAKPDENWELADWVLSKFQESEYKELMKVSKNAFSAVELMVEGKTEEAMNSFN